MKRESCLVTAVFAIMFLLSGLGNFECDLNLGLPFSMYFVSNVIYVLQFNSSQR